MNLYAEERPDIHGPLVAKRMPDVSQAVEAIFQMRDFALWHVPAMNDLSILHAIRTNQLAWNTSQVEGFQPYMSGLDNWWGCIVNQEQVLYSSDGLPLRENRDSFTMNHSDGHNFYTTLTFSEILRILLKNGRILHRARFRFATDTPIIEAKMDPVLLIPDRRE